MTAFRCRSESTLRRAAGVARERKPRFERDPARVVIAGGQRAKFDPGAVQPGTAPVTTVFSSHNLGQVKRLATRVLYLEQGRVLADLPVHEFFNGPLPQAARLFVKGETL